MTRDTGTAHALSVVAHCQSLDPLTSERAPGYAELPTSARRSPGRGDQKRKPRQVAAPQRHLSVLPLTEPTTYLPRAREVGREQARSG